MTNNSTLANLENYGRREILEAAGLMQAYAKGKAPSWFYDDGVTVEFNPNSGNVFLTNSDFQVLMLDNDKKLYSFYFLSYAGNEGDAESLYLDYTNGNINENDYEQLVEILEQEGMDDEAEKIQDVIEKSQEIVFE